MSSIKYSFKNLSLISPLLYIIYIFRGFNGLDFILICAGNRPSPTAKDDYDAIKILSEGIHGCLTTFVQGKNVARDIQNLDRGRAPEVARNIWLKLNEKCGGTNWKIEVPLPTVTVPIMVVGCAFSHADADDDGTKPTCVGFAATTKFGATGLVNFVEHQDPRLNIVSRNALKASFEKMIVAFCDVNDGQRPQVIIWYRGGASSGAYQQILKNEMKVLRELCAEKNYYPSFSFIVCIRNSHSKLFALNAKDQVGDGLNVPAGTVVSGYGGTPDSFHFHLCSHAGVGTVNPTFYQVYFDTSMVLI